MASILVTVSSGQTVGDGGKVTVKEVLALLSKMPDHEVKLMIDCPHCGHSKEVKRVEKIVIIAGKDEA